MITTISKKRSSACLFCAAVLLVFVRPVRAETVYETTIRPLIQKYCFSCHGGDDVSGDVDLLKIRTQQQALDQFDVWESATELIRDSVMPPEDQPQPSVAEKETILRWYQNRFVDSVQAHPGHFRPRRLSAHEFRNTLHSVFGFSLDVAIIEAEQTVSEKSLVMKLLPTDPPGASGFKNDTSGNPLTTVVWDQYAYLVDFAIEKLFSVGGHPQLNRLVGSETEGTLSHEQAATLLRRVARAAYRRHISDDVIARSLANLAAASPSERQRVTRQEMKTVLMSPRFFYRGLMMQIPRDRIEPVDAFELAERISYFLWADMPDEELMHLAAVGSLTDRSVLERQIDRMLASPKSRSLAEHLGVEWFSLDEIDSVSNNPPVADALKSQPIDYLHYLFTEGRPVLELIDSDVAFVNAHTAKYYPGDRTQLVAYKKGKGIEVERLPNQKIDLVQSVHRGGFLTIPGVLAMNRGPVLRGTWMLERILGDDLPEPPANVGQVPSNRRGDNLTFRERFEIHRSNTTCAVCHDKIDPLGFALQYYDDSGAHLLLEKPGNKRRKIETAVDVEQIDASGRLPSGETFHDFEELKQILTTSRKEPVIRNVVERFLAYALCRKLEYHDRPTVDRIHAKLLQSDGTFRDLIHEVCTCLPMRQAFVRSDQNRDSRAATGETTTSQ
ncbi:DUF1592 domain-containing protein [Stieleria sp.]|uniref:DUF1592 domain-containing protein n=1 Tax=Stieleria sp. TaxID=2795976 RepID=UPI003569775E